MTHSEKIQLFINTFQGRRDVVPRHWHSPRTGRSGYAPICRNEWRRPVCRKGALPSPCRQCPGAAYAALTSEMVHRHFKGDHILGVYPLMPGHTCRFLAADFDDHDGCRNPLKDVQAFYEICRFQEFPCSVFRSKSGRGYHAYLFFESPVPAWKARAVGFALLEEAGISGQWSDRKLSSFDRLFPNQDRLSGKGFGNLIALPFQGKAARSGHTLLLDPKSGLTRPYPDQWRQLGRIEKIDEYALDHLMENWRLAGNEGKAQKRRVMPVTVKKYSNDVIRPFRPAEFEPIARQCKFIAHCRDDATVLSEPDWYILLTISARCRDGRRLSHQLSAPYPRYSYQKTDAKITQALTRTGPYRCRTIERINPAYCSTCRFYHRITSPIRLGTRVQRCSYPPVRDPGGKVSEQIFLPKMIKKPRYSC